MKIRGLNTHSMRNDAHFQFFTEFKILVERFGAEALKIQPLFDSYLLLYNEEDDALKRVKKSILTQKIEEADKARDETWHGMLNMNEAGLKHFSPESKEAAKKLQILFDTYGNVAKKRMNEQTSALYNILKDLEEHYASEAAIVNITRWISELKDRNQVFGNLVRARFDEAYSRTGTALRDAKKAVNLSYRAIRNRINALIEVEGAAAYEEFVGTLNVIIDKYALSNGKPKKKEKEKNQEEEAQAETEAEQST